MRLNTNHAHILNAEKRQNANRRNETPNRRNGAPDNLRDAGDKATALLSSLEEVDVEWYVPRFNGINNAASESVAAEPQFDVQAWAEESDVSPFAALSAQNEAAGGNQAQINDNSGNLTRRLVSASNTFVLHKIIGDAFKDLGELRLALAMSDGEDADTIRQVIRRLERVIRRGNRKISELNREAALERKQDNALKEDKQQRAEQIEAELRRQIIRRRNRERGYLEELAREEIMGAINSAVAKLDPATEARITAQAQAIAAAQTSAGSAGGLSASGGGLPGSGAGSGGSASGAKGGSLEGEMADSVDVSV